MKHIPKERRDAILAKLSGPDRKSVVELAKLEAISVATLYNWRKQARLRGELMPDHDDSPDGWAAQDKFNAVLQTATMSESQISEYCRSQGLYPEQIQRWKLACQSANDWDTSQRSQLAQQQRDDKKRIKELERDLLRKEKALAEAAALLILQKKVRAIWGDEDA
jgi:transposase-like protein